MNSALSFGPIIKQISSFMRIQQPEPVVEQDESKDGQADIPAEEAAHVNVTVDNSGDTSFTTYRQCFDDFFIDELELPTKDSLDSYLATDKNMKNIEKGE